jgi:hypothetical protein
VGTSDPRRFFSAFGNLSAGSQRKKRLATSVYGYDRGHPC